MMAMSAEKNIKTVEVVPDMDEKNVYTYPNPSKGLVTIRFPSRKEEIIITIYDMNNNLVWKKDILAAELNCGINRIDWNCINDTGKNAANGIYFLNMTNVQSGKNVIKKIAVVR
jgi:flagellar hook assembly protein FlgD